MHIHDAFSCIFTKWLTGFPMDTRQKRTAIANRKIPSFIARRSAGTKTVGQIARIALVTKQNV